MSLISKSLSQFDSMSSPFSALPNSRDSPNVAVIVNGIDTDECRMCHRPALGVTRSHTDHGSVSRFAVLTQARPRRGGRGGYFRGLPGVQLCADRAARAAGGLIPGSVVPSDSTQDNDASVGDDERLNRRGRGGLT